jgi:hypothetical protein
MTKPTQEPTRNADREALARLVFDTLFCGHYGAYDCLDLALHQAMGLADLLESATSVEGGNTTCLTPSGIYAAASLIRGHIKIGQTLAEQQYYNRDKLQARLDQMDEFAVITANLPKHVRAAQ